MRAVINLLLMWGSNDPRPKYSSECHSQDIIETDGISDDFGSSSYSESDIDFKKSRQELAIHLWMVLALHNSHQ